MNLLNIRFILKRLPALRVDSKITLHNRFQRPLKTLGILKTKCKLIIEATLSVAGLILLPVNGYATQLHASSEGIITHQVGHLFFLFSMVALIFTITGKGLDKQKGWRLIQYSAIFFILWNLDAITAHFFDNQLQVVKIENISLMKMKIVTSNDSSVLSWFYYVLKLDHLLCVPAIVFLYKGLSTLVDDQRRLMVKKGSK